MSAEPQPQQNPLLDDRELYCAQWTLALTYTTLGNLMLEGPYTKASQELEHVRWWQLLRKRRLVRQLDMWRELGLACVQYAQMQDPRPKAPESAMVSA